LHPGNSYSSTGIGLSIVKRIIARPGGEIWGEGGPGNGPLYILRCPMLDIIPGLWLNIKKVKAVRAKPLKDGDAKLEGLNQFRLMPASCRIELG